MELPRNLYEQELDGKAQIESEGQVFYVTEKIEVEKGILQYLRGAQYPQKGLASPQALFAVNQVKRMFVVSFKLMSKWWAYPSLALIALMPHRARLGAIEFALQCFCDASWKAMSPYVLKQEHMTPAASELRSACRFAMRSYGISHETAYRAAAIISHMIEYDNAYRFRMQDLFTESSKDALVLRPIREIRRLARIAVERDTNSPVSQKFSRIASLASVALLDRRFRMAFVGALLMSEFTRLQFDDGDEYYVSMRTDYDFFGEEPSVRAMRNAGKSMPIPYPRSEFESMRQAQEKAPVLIPKQEYDAVAAGEKHIVIMDSEQLRRFRQSGRVRKNK